MATNVGAQRGRIGDCEQLIEGLRTRFDMLGVIGMERDSCVRLLQRLSGASPLAMAEAALPRPTVRARLRRPVTAPGSRARLPTRLATS